MFLFVILFGLSMDYHVFILSRIKELRDGGLSTEEAVSRGIRRTAGTVTSAAIIMVAVFAIFGTLRMIMMKQMGVGLGTRRPDRRDGDPRRAASRLDEAARRVELVPAALARMGAVADAGAARGARAAPGPSARALGRNSRRRHGSRNRTLAAPTSSSSTGSRVKESTSSCSRTAARRRPRPRRATRRARARRGRRYREGCRRAARPGGHPATSRVSITKLANAAHAGRAPADRGRARRRLPAVRARRGAVRRPAATVISTGAS